MIRVLVVDDSPTARALISEILALDPDIDVVGEARDGGEAVRLCAELKPDVVTMDIRMPVLDGFEATHRIMSTTPTRIVVVSGNPSLEEVAFTLKAMEAGALHVQRKPPGPDSPEFERAAESLVAAVKAMAGVRVVRRLTPRSSEVVVRPRPGGAIEIVGIAASTGGPPALKTVLGALPSDFPVPILIVQHIAPGFLGGFAEWLDHGCPLRVRIADDGEMPRAGGVYVAPEGRHLEVARDGRLALSSAPSVHGFRPSATVMFRSLAEVKGRRAAGVILTGMGCDGVAGLVKLREEGSLIVAQSQETSAVFGMPGAAIAAGVASEIADLEAIAPLLVREVKAR